MFVILAVVAVLVTVVSFILRPQPNRIPEGKLYTSVESIEDGMKYREVCSCLGLQADSTWFDKSESGFAVWRFEVSDVRYDDSRASLFVKFQEGTVVSTMLLYPLEAAGGGMTF